jgi:hypothetical protein
LIGFVIVIHALLIAGAVHLRAIPR